MYWFIYMYLDRVSEQLSSYLTEHNILSYNESGIKKKQKKHSTTTAAIKVLNYIIEALDKGNHCASLFTDL